MVKCENIKEKNSCHPLNLILVQQLKTLHHSYTGIKWLELPSANKVFIKHFEMLKCRILHYC